MSYKLKFWGKFRVFFLSAEDNICRKKDKALKMTAVDAAKTSEQDQILINGNQTTWTISS